MSNKDDTYIPYPKGIGVLRSIPINNYLFLNHHSVNNFYYKSKLPKYKIIATIGFNLDNIPYCELPEKPIKEIELEEETVSYEIGDVEPSNIISKTGSDNTVYANVLKVVNGQVIIKDIVYE